MKKHSIVGYVIVFVAAFLLSLCINVKNSEHHDDECSNMYYDIYHEGYEDGYAEGEDYGYMNGYESGYDDAADDTSAELASWYTNDFSDLCYRYTGVRLYTYEEFYSFDETRDFYFFAYRHGYDDALAGHYAEVTQDDAYKNAPDIFYHFP